MDSCFAEKVQRHCLLHDIIKTITLLEIFGICLITYFAASGLFFMQKMFLVACVLLFVIVSQVPLGILKFEFNSRLYFKIVFLPNFLYLYFILVILMILMIVHILERQTRTSL